MAIASREFMPQSRTRSFDTRLFLGVVALCILVSNLALFYAKRDGLPYRDFKIFYSGARILQAYPGTELYNLDLQARVQTELLHIKTEEALPYNHPPFELLLFLPLAGLSYSLAFYLWIAISIACGIVRREADWTRASSIARRLAVDALCARSVLVSFFHGDSRGAGFGVGAAAAGCGVGFDAARRGRARRILAGAGAFQVSGDFAAGVHIGVSSSRSC